MMQCAGIWCSDHAFCTGLKIFDAEANEHGVSLPLPSMNSVSSGKAFEKIDGVAARQRPTVFVMNPTHVRSSKKANTMIRPDSPRFRRRQFLQTLSGLAAGAFGAMLA